MNRINLPKKLIRVSVIVILLLIISGAVVLLVREAIYKHRLSSVQSQLNKRFKIEKKDGSVYGEIFSAEKRQDSSPKIKYTVHLMVSSPQIFRNAICNHEECRERFFYEHAAGIFMENNLVGDISRAIPVYCNKPEQNKVPSTYEESHYICEDKDQIGKYPTSLFLINYEFVSETPINFSNAEIRFYPIGFAEYVENVQDYPADHRLLIQKAREDIIQKGDEFKPSFNIDLPVVDEKSITMLKSTSYGKENLATKSKKG